MPGLSLPWILRVSFFAQGLGGTSDIGDKSKLFCLHNFFVKVNSTSTTPHLLFLAVVNFRAALLIFLFEWAQMLEQCPAYPLPFTFGTWPTSYTYEGKFPEGFVWGLGTASYQVEGAYKDEGRGASIWDTFTGADTVGMPGSVCNKAPCPVNEHMKAIGDTGNVACDQYHTYKDDVKLMVDMGLKWYRFSVAWPRVVPTGDVKDGVNQKALEYYSNLVDELIKNGITPAVTLYHWDLPQGLLDSSKGTHGWYDVDSNGVPTLSIVPHFVAFADLVFQKLGDRVKFWITFNEAWTFTYLASGAGKAPSIPEYGDVKKWPWIAGHAVLIAHAKVVQLFRTKYAAQKGRIGITNNAGWREPKTNSPADAGASERCMQMSLGWFSDPVFFGDYPAAMKQILGERLPSFSDEEKQLLKGSADFFGLNHYGTNWVSDAPEAGWTECFGSTSHEGFTQAQSAWLFGSGWGFRKILNWVHKRYNGPDIYVTEGGWSLDASTAEAGVKDLPRTMYYANYTAAMRKAIYEDGVNVKGYFAWSLMDNFEWEMGYKERFGVVYTNFTTQERTRKDSSRWLQAVWASNALVDPFVFFKLKDGPGSDEKSSTLSFAIIGAVAGVAVVSFTAFCRPCCVATSQVVLLSAVLLAAAGVCVGGHMYKHAHVCVGGGGGGWG